MSGLKAIVTGGAGFIGSHVAEALISRGYEVIVLDDLSTGDVKNVPEGAVFVKGDVSRAEDLARVRDLVHGDEAVIAHLAALVSVPEAMQRPLKAFEVNVIGTVNVIELARQLDAYVVVASSAAVYGDPPSLPVSEDTPTRPMSTYGASKLASEAAALAMASERGIRASALRLFNVYGPRMRPGPYAGVVLKFLSAALLGTTPEVYGDGMNTRDFVYVSDVAEAFASSIERRAVGVFNVGTGSETSVLELLEIVSRVTGVQLRPAFRPPRPGDIRRSVADVRRAREALAWSPRVPLEEGLRLTYGWLRSLSPSTRTS